MLTSHVLYARQLCVHLAHRHPTKTWSVACSELELVREITDLLFHPKGTKEAEEEIGIGYNMFYKGEWSRGGKELKPWRGRDQFQSFDV